MNREQIQGNDREAGIGKKHKREVRWTGPEDLGKFGTALSYTHAYSRTGSTLFLQAEMSVFLFPMACDKLVET